MAKPCAAHGETDGTETRNENEKRKKNKKTRNFKKKREKQKNRGETRNGRRGTESEEFEPIRIDEGMSGGKMEKRKEI